VVAEPAGRDAELLVERRDDDARLSGTTVALNLAVLRRGDCGDVSGMYVLFTPDAPLEVGREYRARLSWTTADGTAVESSTVDFTAGSAPSGEPFDGVEATGVAVKNARFESCCWDATNSCGRPEVCVAEFFTETAMLAIAVDRERADARFLYRVDDDPLNVFGVISAVEDESDEFCADFSAQNVETGETTSRVFCVPRPETIARERVDPFEVAYDRRYCLGPPTETRCVRREDADAERCAPTEAELAEAWCAYNVDCLEGGDDDSCRFYSFYCGAGTGESSGCATVGARRRYAAVAFSIALFLMVGRLRRRR